MKKTKTYFSKLSEEFSQTKKWLLEEMKEYGITELKVNEAKRIIGGDFYFCKAFDAMGEKGSFDYDGCGRICDEYTPRNGKSGCCKHRSFCYKPGKKFILTIDGVLIEAPEITYEKTINNISL